MADGVWSIPVLIPNNPLGYTLAYAIETPKGPVLVDNGWNDDQSWLQLCNGLVEAGFEITSCYGVLVTHAHADHHGLSERVRRASGAWVAMHSADAMLLSRRLDEREWLMQCAALLIASGADERDISALPKPGQMKFGTPSRPNRFLIHGERVDVPGRDIVAISTPGHTPGHCCFYDQDAKLMFSGDHVLPRISPHIGLYEEMEQDDPLGDYLASLERVAGYDVATALPGHERTFTEWASRVREIIGHHDVRLRAVLGRLAEGAATELDLGSAMEWSRPWQSFVGLAKRAALSEARAHVRTLERRGVVERVQGTRPVAFRLATK